MKAAEAKTLFHGVEKLNCAQAVLKAFEKEHGVSEREIQAASKNGGGRAQNGLCGALHSARSLVNGVEEQERLEGAFEAQAGALKCREIRELRRLSCKECVGLSAELVQQHYTG